LFLKFTSKPILNLFTTSFSTRFWHKRRRMWSSSRQTIISMGEGNEYF